MRNAFTGSWRLTDMELWDGKREIFSGPRPPNSKRDGTGELRFLAV